MQWVKDLVVSLLRLGCCYGTDLIHGLGTSTCHGHGQKKEKSRNQKVKLYLETNEDKNTMIQNLPDFVTKAL